MAVFTPPLRTDWTFAEGSNLSPPERRFWAHFGTQPRGRSVLKIAGTWTTVDHPTTTQIEDADSITDTLGQSVPGVFYGGHVYAVTATVEAELIADGFGDNIT